MRFLLALILSLLPGVALAAPLSFTIGTSEPVVVDTSGGTPLISLDFGGGEARAATYRSGSGTAALEFAYDIAAGDFAPSGIVAAGQIELAGGAIRDLAGNPLTLSFTPPDLSGVRVRTYRPVWTTDPITAANASAAAFEITKAPLGATFAWEITSDGGGSLSGSGTIASAPHPVTGLDLSALGDGTLTLSLTLTTAAGTSAPRTVTVAKEAPWTPADLGPALALWLDADDLSTITLVDGAVSEWLDKSGNGRHAAQPTAARRPGYLPNNLNARSSLVFTHDVLSGSIPALANRQDISFVGVYTHHTLGNYAVMLGSGGAVSVPNSTAGIRWGLFGAGTTQTDALGWAGSSGSTHLGVNSLPNAPAILHYQKNASGWIISHNGTPINTVSDTSFPTGIFFYSIGAERNPSTPGDIYTLQNSTVNEVLVVDTALTISDRQRLEGYLAHKWGLAGSLPADHPWKAAAP